MEGIYETLCSLNSFHISLALHCSAHSKCGSECLTQSRVAERLEQAIYSALFQQACTDALIGLSGYKDNWDFLPASHQFLLQIGSCHAWHDDIENQTPGLPDAIGREELFGRRECPYRIA